MMTSITFKLYQFEYLSMLPIFDPAAAYLLLFKALYHKEADRKSKVIKDLRIYSNSECLYWNAPHERKFCNMIYPLKV